MDLITINAADGQAEAYVAKPPSGTGPGVLLCIDAIGLRPQIQKMADRMASWGYVVLAPNTMYRSGTAAETSPTTDLTAPGAREEFFKDVGPRLKALTNERMAADAAAYTEALVALPEVTGDKLGVTGYCMGARMATIAAGNDKRYGAAGGFHGGGLVVDDEHSPHKAIAGAAAEFVYGHADNDQSMTPDNVAELGKALDAAGLTASNVIYEGAAHGYTMADTSVYNEQAAERHYAELQAAFDRNLR